MTKYNNIPKIYYSGVYMREPNISSLNTPPFLCNIGMVAKEYTDKSELMKNRNHLTMQCC
jgi:hypothetical protein